MGEEVMSKRRFGPMLAIAAAVFAMAPGLMVMPVASADVLPNGYDVNCQVNGTSTICTVAGCPRVYEDYAGDVVHLKVNGGPQSEVGKNCNSTTTQSFFGTSGFNLAVQGCRKHTTSGDDCGPWSDYKFTPPAPAAPPPPPPVSQAPVVPPPVVVPDPPKVAPTNAVTMNISVSIPNSTIDIASSADIAGNCTYSATAPLLPSVNKSFALPPNGSTSFTTLSPPLLATYHVVLSCKGPFDGKTVEYGHVEQNVTAAG